MKLKSLLYGIAMLGLVFLAIDRYWPRNITEVVLSQQLTGAHCRFSYDIDSCEQRGFEPVRSLFTEDHDCDMWAVRCLMDFRSPATENATIIVLSTKTDVQTCDGVRPIRSYAVKYLGDFGSRLALPALKKHLASKPRSKLSRGASGCRAAPEKVEAIRAAITKIENR